MFRQFILLMALFTALLFFGFYAASYEHEWTRTKVRRFYVYLATNVLLGLGIFILYARYTSLMEIPADSADVSGNSLAIYAGLITLIGNYILAIIGLLFSIKLWPFDKAQKIIFKTLLVVVFVMLIAELLTGIKIPHSIPINPFI